MSNPIKDNAYILANKTAFQAAYERAREYFSRFEGVVGVGFGQKSTGGSYQEDICFVVYVTEKKSPGEVPTDQRIPEYFEGYKTDVLQVTPKKLHACSGGDATYDNIMGGIQVTVAKYVTSNDPAHPGQQQLTVEYDAGTMCCIVRNRGDADRTNVYLLSNHHVLFAKGGVNDYVYHPYPDKMQGKDSTTLGPVQAITYFDNVTYPDGSPNKYFLDCAIARIDIDCTCLGTRCTKDVIKYKAGKIVYRDDSDTPHEVDITDVRDVINDPAIIGQKVFKCGAVTKRTAGFVRHVNSTVPTLNDDGTAGPTALNTIDIEFDSSSTSNHLNCAGRPAFSEQGDSGSAIFDEQGRIIGILFAGPPNTVPNPLPPDFWHSSACHIVPLIDKMNICIPVTTAATTHGTCAATDGSGVTPAPNSVSNAGAGGGALGFRGNGYTDAPEQPVPLSEEQEYRLNNLLQALRSTPKGRMLHGEFAHVRREIGYLVRHCRPVTVAWHRNKGPAFFACLLNHLRGDIEKFPHELNGVQLGVLLSQMETVLMQYGSNPLKNAIQQYGNDIKLMLLSGNDADEFISYLEKTETA